MVIAKIQTSSNKPNDIPYKEWRVHFWVGDMQYIFMWHKDYSSGKEWEFLYKFVINEFDDGEWVECELTSLSRHVSSVLMSLKDGM